VTQTIALGETVLTTPAIDNGALYVRSDGKLWKNSVISRAGASPKSSNDLGVIASGSPLDPGLPCVVGLIKAALDHRKAGFERHGLPDRGVDHAPPQQVQSAIPPPWRQCPQ